MRARVCARGQAPAVAGDVARGDRPPRLPAMSREGTGPCITCAAPTAFRHQIEKESRCGRGYNRRAHGGVVARESARCVNKLGFTAWRALINETHGTNLQHCWLVP